MKVYVIEKGQYSGRYVAAVTDNEEEAKLICEAIADKNYEDDATYTEFDTEQFRTNLLRFEVSYYTYDEPEVHFCEYWEWNEIKSNTRIHEDEYVVFARNKEEALKIAQDMRAEGIAKRKGIL